MQESKKQYRKTALDLRKSISQVDRESKNKLIFNELVNSEEYKRAKSVFIYVSYNYEVDTISIIKHSFRLGKEVYVPLVISMKDGMKAIKINSMSDLHISKYGMLEPKECGEAKSAKEFDLMVIPGVALDKSGNRIGYGGGFYDRFLAELRSSEKVVAIVFKEQIFESVPSCETDFLVKRIIFA